MKWVQAVGVITHEFWAEHAESDHISSNQRKYNQIHKQNKNNSTLHMNKKQLETDLVPLSPWLYIGVGSLQSTIT